MFSFDRPKHVTFFSDFLSRLRLTTPNPNAMEPNNSTRRQLVCNEENINRIKEAYSKETKDEPSKRSLCLKLIMAGATEKNPNERLKSATTMSEFLTSRGGVLEFISTMIDFDLSSQKTTTLNQRFLAIAKLISCSPGLCMPYPDYCNNISRQIIHLLSRDPDAESDSNSKFESQYLSLACIITRALLESPHAVGKEIIVENIVLGPIISSFKNESGPLSVSEALLSIYNLLESHISSKYFIDVFANLFYAKVAVRGMRSRYETIISRCIVCILNHLEPGPGYCLIEATLSDRSIEGQLYKSLCTIEDLRTTTESIDSELEATTESLFSILEECDNEPLALECFFNFHAKMLVAQDKYIRKFGAFYLLHPKINEDSSKLNPLNSVISNCTCSLDSIYRTLLNYLEFLRSPDCNIREASERLDSPIGFCVSILEVLAKQVTKAIDLDILHTKVVSALEEIRDLVDSCCTQLSKNICSFLEELGSCSSNLDKDLSNSIGARHDYDKALIDLNDRLPPIRVHALVRFKQSVMANDIYTISRISQLYDLVESSLTDEESYVYLACINLVAIMCVRETEKLLPKLLNRYSEEGLAADKRVRFGEVLVRLAKALNAAAPYYAHQIMYVLLKGTQDSDELIRMSSLTNMGEICRYLGHSLGKYVLDILQCVERAINNDTIHVKCAAIDLIGSALMGLDELHVESVQQELRSIYGLLKKLRRHTLDEKLTIQIDRALGEVDRLAKSMLGLNAPERERCEKTLVKSIKVLSLLD